MKLFHTALATLTAFALISCKKEEEAPKNPPEVQRGVDFALLQTEALQHPAFSVIAREPAVMEASQANADAYQAYTKTKHEHPAIKPLSDRMLTLPATEPERATLARKIEKIAKEQPEIQKLWKAANDSMIDLIAAYGNAFKAHPEGKEIGEKFLEIASRP